MIKDNVIEKLAILRGFLLSMPQIGKSYGIAFLGEYFNSGKKELASPPRYISLILHYLSIHPYSFICLVFYCHLSYVSAMASSPQARNWGKASLGQ